jgi:hypothetical protein
MPEPFQTSSFQSFDLIPGLRLFAGRGAVDAEAMPMPVTLCLPARASPPVCSALIIVQGVRGDAAPFFLGRITKADAAARTGKVKPMAHDGKAAKARGGPVPRQRVVARLWRTAERQVGEVEARLAALEGDPQALEREAKTLAIIARTIRDLVAIDLDGKPAKRGRRKEQAQDHGFTSAPGDDPARDIDAFRAELARRLDELRRERGGDAAP